jgi:hypothetical protein
VKFFSLCFTTQIVARDKYLTLMSGGLITELPLFVKEPQVSEKPQVLLLLANGTQPRQCLL